MQKHVKTKILTVTLLLMFTVALSVSVFNLSFVPKVKADWLSGWSHRKTHMINNATGAGTNYQMKITVHYAGGSNTGEDVYCGGHCRTDFGDIRFTDNDETTLLDYWMESKTNADNAVFWVEITDDLSSSDVTIYMYHGKADATTTSNGDDTFDFFDDFLGASINTTKWAGNTAHTVVSDSVVTLTTDDYESRKVYQNDVNFPDFLFPKALRFKGYFQARGTNVYNGLGWRELPSEPNEAYFFPTATNEQLAYADSGSGSQYLLSDFVRGAWRTYDILWIETKLEFYDNGVLVENGTITEDIPEVNQGAWIYAYGQSDIWVKLDWIFVRNYVSPEPQHGSWEPPETEYEGDIHFLFETGGSLGFQNDIDKTVILNVDSGTLNSITNSFSLGSHGGHFHFTALSDTQIKIDHTFPENLWVSGDQNKSRRIVSSGSTITVDTGNNVRIKWVIPIEVWLVPMMFIIGMVGLFAMIAGPLYGAHLLKNGEYYEGFRTGLVVTVVGFAFFIAWLVL